MAEICKILIDKETLQMLVDSGAITTDEFTLVGVDENAIDYTSNEVWKALKAKSTKAYKDLKELEFKIRFPE